MARGFYRTAVEMLRELKRGQEIGRRYRSAGGKFSSRGEGGQTLSDGGYTGYAFGLKLASRAIERGNAGTLNARVMEPKTVHVGQWGYDSRPGRKGENEIKVNRAATWEKYNKSSRWPEKAEEPPKRIRKTKKGLRNPGGLMA